MAIKIYQIKHMYLYLNIKMHKYQELRLLSKNRKIINKLNAFIFNRAKKAILL